MAKTNAEKLRDWKARHKGEDKYKERRRLENKLHYEKKKASESCTLKLLRQKDARLRKQKSRAAARQQMTPAPPVKITPASMDKAVKKTLLRGLPRSPRKRKIVLARLTEMEGIKVVGMTETPIVRNRIAETVVAAVLHFYEREDISRVDPGMKSAVVLKRIIVPRRHMLHTLRETYAIFHTEFPEHAIKVSKFAMLKPSHIKPYKDIPHNVCVCRYHENIRSVFMAVASKLPQLGNSVKEFVSSNVCDVVSFECMSLACLSCRDNFDNVLKTNEEVIEETVSYLQWAMVDKRIEHVTINKTLTEAKQSLRVQLAPFLIHSFIKDHSQTHFNATRNNATTENVVLQVDFAENYTAQYRKTRY